MIENLNRVVLITYGSDKTVHQYFCVEKAPHTKDGALAQLRGHLNSQSLTVDRAITWYLDGIRMIVFDPDLTNDAETVADILNEIATLKEYTGKIMRIRMHEKLTDRVLIDEEEDKELFYGSAIEAGVEFTEETWEEWK